MKPEFDREKSFELVK